MPARRRRVETLHDGCPAAEGDHEPAARLALLEHVLDLLTRARFDDEVGRRVEIAAEPGEQVEKCTTPRMRGTLARLLGREICERRRNAYRAIGNLWLVRRECPRPDAARGADARDERADHRDHARPRGLVGELVLPAP